MMIRESGLLFWATLYVADQPQAEHIKHVFYFIISGIIIVVIIITIKHMLINERVNSCLCITI